ncbi:outer membrane beta-barrel protein [Flavobacterium pectinovorum]|uniref:Outer membrane protein beta-barrel domain-containing protein n=1 Tax=Flavobacterium pectinovorum TaxID=29533 RepID=A0A502F4F2_9FLAO|nr:outer membrane beta-barrel protein [Flavobacterium pectinovorum]TPG44114.1 hypothetical protein EAH81_06090 [Flavobacterium pectinovorum]
MDRFKRNIYTQGLKRNGTGKKAINISGRNFLAQTKYMNNVGQIYGFTYKRNIYSAYVSSSFSLFNGFLNGKAGLRYEHTNTTADFVGVAYRIMIFLRRHLQFSINLVKTSL